MCERFRLTPFGPGDAPVLTELFRRNDRPEVTSTFDPFPLTASSAERIVGHEGRDLYWGVWSGDALVGLAMVRGWDGGHPQRAYGIFIDREHAGRGLGRWTTAAVVGTLRGLGETAVRARVHADNRASLAMLRSCGFRELSRTEDRILLECDLERRGG